MAKKEIITADFAEDVFLLALASQAKDYFIAFQLNSLFNFKLEKKDDIEFELKKKGRTVLFSHYVFENEDEQIRVELFSNKYQGEFLIPEIKLADFWLLITGIFSTQQKNEVLSALKVSNHFQTCKEVEATTLKSKQHLLFY